MQMVVLHNLGCFDLVVYTREEAEKARVGMSEIVQ